MEKAGQKFSEWVDEDGKTVDQEIIFDFRDVEILGQGFADEVFRVFQNRYPEIVLTVQNANKSVQGMIRHVSGGRNKTYPL